MDLESFIESFAELFEETDVSAIQADTDYKQMDEWSSLTAMSIIAMVRTQYGKRITGREIRKCRTVRELYQLVCEAE